MNKLKDLLWEEVSIKMIPENYDGDIEFAVRHGLVDVAVYLWCGTGASSYEFSKSPVTVEQFKNQCKKLDELSDKFECTKCNHIGFYDKNEFESIDWCYNCGDKSVKFKMR